MRNVREIGCNIFYLYVSFSFCWVSWIKLAESYFSFHGTGALVWNCKCNRLWVWFRRNVKYLIPSFSALVTSQNAALSFATQHTFPPKICKNWKISLLMRTYCLYTKFPGSLILLCYVQDAAWGHKKKLRALSKIIWHKDNLLVVLNGIFDLYTLKWERYLFVF